MASEHTPEADTKADAALARRLQEAEQALGVGVGPLGVGLQEAEQARSLTLTLTLTLTLGSGKGGRRPGPTATGGRAGTLPWG